MGRRRGLGRGLLRGLGLLGGGALAAAGGWILYSRSEIDHDLPLPPALPADREKFAAGEAGELSYYAARQADGRPLVLLHSINAAASAYEMKPLFEHFREQRPVYALDWPGYGFSDRSDRRYVPGLFAHALAGFLAERVGEPADVVALSLGGEFAARAAVEQPEFVRSLVLISPTGFGSSSPEDRGQTERLHAWLSFPLWSQALFDLVATRRSIAYFLGQSFVGPVPADFIEYAYRTAHQPGARYAPVYFLSGGLFTPMVRSRLYGQLVQPVLALYDRDPYVRFDQLPEFVAARSRWQAVRLRPSLGLPHFERLAEVVEALEAFWDGLRSGSPGGE